MKTLKISYENLRKEYQKYGKKDTLQIWSWVDFLWRKKYTWLLLFLAISGTLVIWYLFNPGLSDYLVYYTFWVIFWYSRETMDLKRISNKELEHLRESEMNKFLPIIIAREGGRLHVGADNADLTLEIENIGKGIAKVKEIKLATVTIEENFNLAPGQPREVKIYGSKDYIVRHLSQNPDQVFMEILYEDLYERRFRTVETTFNRNAEGHYDLDRGKWKFQKL